MPKADRGFEIFASKLNDRDDRLPKGRSRCFDIGMCGGCGATCAAFVDGECDVPEEIPLLYLIEVHGKEDAQSIIELYPEGTFK